MDSSNLASLDELFARSIAIEKEISGIYFLFFGLEIVYVGKSINVFRRVFSHVDEGWKAFDRWAYVNFPTSDLAEAERQYIAKFMPKYNMDVTTAKTRAKFLRLKEPPSEAGQEFFDDFIEFARTYQKPTGNASQPV